ncbi:MAG: class I SAM-dependent DNA methyltransferase [Spirochaetaceae bacterium]|nr:class I SAM-dependent DNA methyltransferase [Spirochaetaceae bacterium]
MTQTEQQRAAKKFSQDWQGKGYEKGESQKFWLDLLCNVFGVQDFANFVHFENQIKDTFQDKTITNFIDVYIPATKVMVEQKSSGKDLRKAIRQSDGTLLTPFQQAKKYIAGLPLSQHPRWVVTCNFEEFLVYDMEQPDGEPESILLENLEREYYRLSFLTEQGSIHLKRELEISKKAGDIIGEIYDAILRQYKDADNPSPQTLKSLNMLCVRIVFCLYAEDAGIFGHKSMFGDYLKQQEAKNLRRALLDLFQILDQREQERDEYLEESLLAFPYVNGGLFTEADRTIPQLTEEIKELLVRHASSEFDWSEISPTIFGAIFESTLNPETRRTGGMHYTSIENIHKVIDPLFMDELWKEFTAIKEMKQEKARETRLIAFQRKLGSLQFLDPACGSGNFLTEAYLSLRRLENECLKLRFNNNAVLDVFEDTVFVKIHQFYGIEINDFAAVVAKTALWIAESQMMAETASILQRNLEFLPLKSYANIVEGNALQMDWESVVPTGQLSYIMGNPPFVGARLMSKEQKEDVLSVWGAIKNIGNLDYVSCWYKKTSDAMKNTTIKAALVSTNSITQGEQVAIMWKPLMEMGVKIDFAYRTFRWDSESNAKAHVHCVIVGFSCHRDSEVPRNSTGKRIFNPDGTVVLAQNINGYLLDNPDIFIESRSKPLCAVPEIGIGNKPIDGGNYLFTEDEMKAFVRKEPLSEKYFKKWLGADEFINGYYRYCLWLGDCSPAELLKMPECLKRVQAVRELRLASKSEGTRKLAEKPTRFHVENMPKGNYIVVPKVSSEKRTYIPVGFLSSHIFASDLVFLIPDAEIYHFGVLTSSVHMAWMRAVCGRLESRYRYSKDIVYNNFPWPQLTEGQRARVAQTAQAILDARAQYPDCSPAQLYGDNSFLFPDLVKAHQANDKAVLELYGLSVKATETEIVGRLMEMYLEKTMERQVLPC